MNREHRSRSPAEKLAVTELEGEIQALQERFDRLARDTDDELFERYELKRPPMPPGVYWKLRWLAGWAVRWFASMPWWRRDPWPVGLKQSPATSKARPLLIWAVGLETNYDTFREACDGFLNLEDVLPGYAPVLITDVADFTFFSRLGWLIEYLPQLTREGEQYQERKLKFLARLYYGAPVLPLSAGLEMNVRPDDLRRWLNTR